MSVRMNAITDLLNRNMSGPRWEVTRDVVAGHSGSVAETAVALVDDLRLLDDLLAAGCEGVQDGIDTRIAVEHVVLLLGRLIPAVNTAVADLYMTEISDLENDDAVAAVPLTVRTQRDRLRVLRQQWEAIARREVEGDRERARTAIDLALLAAELNAVNVQALSALLLSRL